MGDAEPLQPKYVVAGSLGVSVIVGPVRNQPFAPSGAPGVELFMPIEAVGPVFDALLATQPLVDFDTKFSELRDKLKNFSGVSASNEPENFKGELRAYQRDGVGWLEFLQDFKFGPV